MKVALVGATGLVGEVMLKVLAERNFPVTELIPVASKKSIGKKIVFNGKSYTIVSIEDAIKSEPNLAIFSAGGDVSKEYAPQFAAVGCKVVDNSSAFRMDNTKKLIVPEINASELTMADQIIANPNCSTIQMVMVLNPLHKKFGVKRVIVSTYQSVTGTGVNALKQMDSERKGIKTEMVYKYQIDKNCIPHCDTFLENGYTKEEMKLVQETMKIMGAPSIKVTATAVRVPVTGGHSESVNVEFEKEFDLKEVKQILGNSKGVKLQDNIETFTYPMPLFADGKDDVFVGRLRRDETQEKTLNMWIVADNLRKGAATNAIQIAEYMVEMGWFDGFN
jgi:aspartate-semialdehyde dehydrogenase